ncbi:MAG: dihydroorotate oxidase [Oscillospiraceae bacterium]|nr:dihydroorotate oxidase [Oscillospiraceae bacterium]
MSLQKICEIIAAEPLTPHAYSITLEAGRIAEEARAGQFVHIRCGDGLLLRRPISICDVNGSRLRIVFEVRGEGTRWLALRGAGEALDVLGPLGHGFDLTGEKLLLVGGGIGVPPMLHTANCSGGEVHAALGFRSADRAMLISEFQQAAKTVAVASDDGSIGVHGYVDGLVREAAARENGFSAILACGPKPMLRSVAAVAAELQIPCQVSMEERMGCGVGACLVCACKTADGHYRHACKDGPVFRAEEVCWDD